MTEKIGPNFDLSQLSPRKQESVGGKSVNNYKIYQAQKLQRDQTERVKRHEQARTR